MPAFPRFQYKALGAEEIRLLILYPGLIYSPVFCQIKHIRQIRDSSNNTVYAKVPNGKPPSSTSKSLIPEIYVESYVLQIVSKRML